MSCHFLLQGVFLTQGLKLESNYLTGRFFTTAPLRKSFHRITWTKMNFSVSWNSLTHISTTLCHRLKLPICVTCSWHSFLVVFIKVNSRNLCWFCVCVFSVPMPYVVTQMCIFDGYIAKCSKMSIGRLVLDDLLISVESHF